MSETVLSASPRPKQRGKFREKGFVAGVIYGSQASESNMVKFEEAALKKILKMHGSNARVAVIYDGSQESGFIKEIQRDAISKQITHVDVQVVSGDHEVRMQIPIVFRGDEALADRHLQLQIYKNEVPVSGMMNLMPETIAVDVSNMEAGDSITLNSLGLNKDLKVGDNEDTLYGIVSHLVVETETENVVTGG